MAHRPQAGPVPISNVVKCAIFTVQSFENLQFWEIQRWGDSKIPNPSNLRNLPNNSQNFKNDTRLVYQSDGGTAKCTELWHEEAQPRLRPLRFSYFGPKQMSFISLALQSGSKALEKLSLYLCYWPSKSSTACTAEPRQLTLLQFLLAVCSCPINVYL